MKALATRRARKPRLGTDRRKEEHTGWLFLLPAAVCWVLWFLIPFAQAFFISFFDYNFANPDAKVFVGLDNYINLFKDPKFVGLDHGALWNTLGFVVVVVPILTVLSLFLACAINQEFKGRGVFRTLYYLPYVIAPIAVATVFMYFFVKDGIASRFLSLFGLPNVTWNANVDLAMPMIGIMFVWQLVGFYMVYYLSGLLSVLAIYRGPLNVWGLGSGIVALLAASGMNPVAAMVALRLDSNIQSVCDPTNSHNVWVSDFTKIDVNEYLKKTILWIMVSTFVGLIVASFFVAI